MLGPVEAGRKEKRPASQRAASTPRSTGSDETPGGASRLRVARSRFRLAYVALLFEGLASAGFGGVALALSMANLRFGERGMPFLGLELTPLHGGVLMVSGALAVLVCLGRWPTVAFAAVAAGGWAALAVVCAVRTGQHSPGVLGFDARDTVFYAVLGAYNLAVCLWLAPMVSTMWRTTRSRAS
jgi:hypothetical protein